MLVVIAVWLLSLAGFTLLAADMKHKKELGSAAFTPRQLLACRVLGMLLLLLSFFACFMRWTHGATAFAVWLGLIGFSALSLGLALTYAPRLIACLARWVSWAGFVAALLLPPEKTAQSKGEAPPGSVP